MLLGVLGRTGLLEAAFRMQMTNRMQRSGRWCKAILLLFVCFLCIHVCRLHRGCASAVFRRACVFENWQRLCVYFFVETKYEQKDKGISENCTPHFVNRLCTCLCACVDSVERGDHRLTQSRFLPDYVEYSERVFGVAIEWDSWALGDLWVVK